MGPLGAAAWLLLALATSSPSHPGGSIQLAAASSLIARAAQIPLSLPPWIKDAERPAVGHASGVEGVAASYLDSVSRAVGQEERVLRIQVPDDALQAEQLMRELEVSSWTSLIFLLPPSCRLTPVYVLAGARVRHLESQQAARRCSGHVL